VNKEVRSWIVKAYEDYITAKHLLSLPDDEIPTSAVCFHSQQLVEKMLKAFLVFHRVSFGRWHNLAILKKLCSEIDEDFKKLDLEGLSIYAVEVRYPEEFFIPSVKEARECFDVMETVKEFMFEKFDINEKIVKKWIREERRLEEKGEYE